MVFFVGDGLLECSFCIINPTYCQHKHIVIMLLALKDGVLGGGFPNLLSSDEFDKNYLRGTWLRFSTAGRYLQNCSARCQTGQWLSLFGRWLCLSRLRLQFALISHFLPKLATAHLLHLHALFSQHLEPQRNADSGGWLRAMSPTMQTRQMLYLTWSFHAMVILRLSSTLFLCINMVTIAFCCLSTPMYSRQPLHPFTRSLILTRSIMNRNDRLLPGQNSRHAAS
jgi:hypothetical protein